MATQVKNNKEETEIFQLVCFKLGNEEYAINIVNVQEVIHMLHTMEVPQMPSFVLGVINVRGEIMPVFDLRIKFNLPIEGFSKKARIIVISTENEKISFVVDEILETLRIDSSRIDPAPPIKMNIKKECVLGIGELEERMIVVLDINEIHRDIKEHIVASNWRDTGKRVG